jgi:cobalt/nickel transport system permease protein
VHIPDGFLATPVWLGLDALAVPAVAWAARRAQRGVEESRAPLLGVMGAFVFAAQMVNFPVGVGTTAHLVGSALLAIALGPAAAMVVMTSILALQAFVFQDGGVLALGANVVNMALAGVAAAWIPYRLLSGRFPRGAAGLAGAAAVAASALLALAELLASGVRIPQPVLWTSLALFAVAAVIEGAITVAVLEAIGRVQPRIVPKPAAAPGWALPAAAVIAIVLASAGAVWAATGPDTLEHLALRVGLAPRAIMPAPLADYHAAFVANGWAAKAAAGVAGLMLAGGLCFGLARAAARRRSA